MNAATFAQKLLTLPVLIFLVAAAGCAKSEQVKGIGFDIEGYQYSYAPRIRRWNDPRLLRSPKESDLEFAQRITMVIHAATYNCETMDPPMQSLTRSLIDAGEISLKPYGLLAIEKFRCGLCH